MWEHPRSGRESPGFASRWLGGYRRCERRWCKRHGIAKCAPHAAPIALRLKSSPGDQRAHKMLTMDTQRLHSAFTSPTQKRHLFCDFPFSPKFHFHPRHYRTRQCHACRPIQPLRHSV
eukprot:scaffold1321_cov402-Prasinococcus_capsulatus_cf.AAC.3